MPSVFSHAAVPLALTCIAGLRLIPPRLAVLAVACAALPDADVIGYHLGVSLGAPLGHRGITHSFAFAACVAAAGAALLARRLGARPAIVAAVLLASTASHGLLDTLTDGGHGVALLLPFSSERFFAPWRPIHVSPLDASRFFSERGLRIVASELRWIWLPAAVLGVGGALVRRALGARGGPKQPGPSPSPSRAASRRAGGRAVFTGARDRR